MSAVVSGRRVISVAIQIALQKRGLPRWRFTGLVNREVREGKERVVAALRASKIHLSRAGVNIAFFPAEQKKTGTALDLGIAIGLLQAHQFLPLAQVAAVAELDLAGTLHSVQQEFALVDYLLSEGHTVIIPTERFLEWQEHPQRSSLRFCSTMAEVIALLQGETKGKVYHSEKKQRKIQTPSWPLSESLVRVLCLCLAGGHHTFLFGSPGVGKSTATKVIESLLPEETSTQLRLRKVRASLLNTAASRVLTVGPVTSRSQLFGSSTKLGLLSSSPDVLFLDEVAEFKADCREALRQFLEITPYTNESQDFAGTVIATSNPCPCGFAGTPRCTCRPDRRAQYLKKISGALLDRFALVWRVGERDQRAYTVSEWQGLRAKIEHVRQVQGDRQKAGFPSWARNYEWQHLERLGFSLNGASEESSFRRQLIPLQLAQTIADWEGKATADQSSISEARFLCSSYSELSMD